MLSLFAVASAKHGTHHEPHHVHGTHHEMPDTHSSEEYDPMNSVLHPPPPECLMPCIPEEPPADLDAEMICGFLTMLKEQHMCYPDCDEGTKGFIDAFQAGGCKMGEPDMPEGEEYFDEEFDQMLEHPEMYADYTYAAGSGYDETWEEVEHYMPATHHEHHYEHTSGAGIYNKKGDHMPETEYDPMNSDLHPPPPECLMQCIPEEPPADLDAEMICGFLDMLKQHHMCYPDCDEATKGFIDGFMDNGCKMEPEEPAGEEEWDQDLMHELEAGGSGYDGETWEEVEHYEPAHAPHPAHKHHNRHHKHHHNRHH